MEEQNIRKQIVKEFNELSSFGYPIEEIIVQLSKKYNKNSEEIKEIIYEEITVLYSLFKKENRFMLFFAFISFIFFILISNQITFGLLVLIIFIYFSFLVDYFVMNGRIKQEIGFFILSLIISFIFIVSFGFVDSKTLLLSFPIYLSILLSLIYFFIERNTLNIFRNIFFFVSVYFSFLLFFYFIFLVLQFLGISIFFGIFIAFLVSFFIYYFFVIKNYGSVMKKILYFIVFSVLIVFSTSFLINSKNILNQIINNFTGFYNLEKIDVGELNSLDLVKSEIGSFDCSEVLNSYKFLIQKNLVNNETNDRYKKILLNQLNKEVCINLENYYNFKYLEEIVILRILKNTQCYRQIEKGFLKKDEEFKTILKENIDNLSKKDLGYFINFLIKANELNRCDFK